MNLPFLQDNLAHPNVQAFLLMLRHSEGTAGVDGYRMLFGGSLFSSFAAHPNVAFHYTNKAGKVIITTAAGAYQIMHTTWVVLQSKLLLPDFSPHSQDIAALQLICDHNALTLILQDNIPSAIQALCNIWASLPGSTAHQPQRSLEVCLGWYEGGKGES